MTPSTKRKVAATLLAVGLGVLAVTQMDSYIQRLLNYAVSAETTIPLWLAPAFAALGIAIIAVGIVVYYFPSDYIASGLSANFQCITARRDELKLIHSMAKMHFGEAITSLSTMKRWHDKNREVFSILFRVRKQGFKQTREMVGYFCVIPLRTQAVEQLISGQIRAVQLQPNDIEKSDTACDAMYIGAIVGTTQHARGNIVSILHREITTRHAKLAREFLTRPITLRGLHLVEKFGFLPIDASSKGGIDALYSFKPDA